MIDSAKICGTYYHGFSMCLWASRSWTAPSLNLSVVAEPLEADWAELVRKDLHHRQSEDLNLWYHLSFEVKLKRGLGGGVFPLMERNFVKRRFSYLFVVFAELYNQGKGRIRHTRNVGYLCYAPQAVLELLLFLAMVEQPFRWFGCYSE